MRNEQLTEEIIQAEWEMFQRTQNIGGRASCQDDRKTFEIMRGSQFYVWCEAALSSYLEDLKEAASSGRNLLTEKYGYMMESTSPQEFAAIKGRLPAVSQRKKELAAEIGSIYLVWSEECAEKYPALHRTGRPLHTSEDTPYATSSETYLRGELYTYSERTLETYLAQVKQAREAGENLCEKTLDHTVQFYGFDSAAAYEAAH